MRKQYIIILLGVIIFWGCNSKPHHKNDNPISPSIIDSSQNIISKQEPKIEILWGEDKTRLSTDTSIKPRIIPIENYNLDQSLGLSWQNCKLYYFNDVIIYDDGHDEELIAYNDSLNIIWQYDKNKFILNQAFVYHENLICKLSNPRGQSHKLITFNLKSGEIIEEKKLPNGEFWHYPILINNQIIFEFKNKPHKYILDENIINENENICFYYAFNDSIKLYGLKSLELIRSYCPKFPYPPCYGGDSWNGFEDGIVLQSQNNIDFFTFHSKYNGFIAIIDDNQDSIVYKEETKREVNGKRIDNYIIYYSGVSNLKCFDTNKNQIIWIYKGYKFHYNDLEIIRSGNIAYINNGKQIQGFNINSGDLLWEYYGNENAEYYRSMEIFDNKLFIIASNERNPNARIFIFDCNKIEKLLIK